MAETFLGKTYTNSQQSQIDEWQKQYDFLKAALEKGPRGYNSEGTPVYEGVSGYSPQVQMEKLKKNIDYYSNNPKDIQDWKLSVAAEIAPSLGLTAAQLVANPDLANNPEALAKYTGGTYNGVSYAPNTNTNMTTGKQATISSPDGKYKTVVTSGSSEASQLMKAGWTLGDSGKSTLDLNSALSQYGGTVGITTGITTGEKLATLSSPDGKFKTVVTSGSSEASQLMKSGWTLGATGVSTLDLQSALKQTGGTTGGTTDKGTKEGETAQEKIEREKQEAEDAQAKQDAYTEKSYAILDQALKDGRISLDEYDLFKSVIQYYPPGIEVDPTEILNTFKTISENTIDPHFAELTKVAATSLQQNLDYLKQQRELEKQTETLKQQQDIEAKKASLEASGMTFTGEGVKQLGTESAFAEQGATGVPQIYGQMPVGMVQQANKLLQSSSLAKYNQQVLEQARSGEAQLGTAGMSGISVPSGTGYNLLGDITGSLKTEEQTAKGSYLQNLLTQAGNRSSYNQNIPLNYSLPKLNNY